MTLPGMLHATIWQEDDIFVAKTIEFEIASQGYSPKEALDNLVEAIQLYLDNDIDPKNLN